VAHYDDNDEVEEGDLNHIFHVGRTYCYGWMTFDCTLSRIPYHGIRVVVASHYHNEMTDEVFYRPICRERWCVKKPCKKPMKF